jgi:hypothetical protein
MAKNDEVAHSFQPLVGAHGGQVADPVIDAEQYYAARKGQRRAARALVECVAHGALSPLQTIEAIAFSPALSDPEKV